RGREHQSRLLSLDFNEKEGMSVFDRGWTMSGLISGEAGEIKEPRVSVKLFFENSNEFLINALIVKEYNRRFKGGQTTFVHVRKPQIYSEFWSFRGSSGAGHSNVRVLSLCDYWAAHFQRQGKLCELSEYVTATTFQLVHREEFWRRCAFYSFEKNAFEIFSIPNYVDIGVLAYHKSLKQLAGFWDSLNIENAIENWETLDIKERLTYLTWNKLDPIKNPKITKAIQAINKTKHSPRYLFAMPSLEEKASFVSFFLELFWSFGGVIFDLRNLFNEYANHCLVNKDKPEKEKEFFNSPKIVLSSDLQFVAEILMLIPERILNKAICSMNWEFPNFLSDISRHAEVLLDKLLKDTETTQSEKNFSIQVQKKSAITEIDDPLKSFFDLYSKKKRCPITDFLVKLREVLANDDIWEGNRNNILAALKNTKKIVAGMMKIKENGEKEKNKKIKNEKEHILIILYFVISRIITNRERYQKLLKWHLDLEKEKDTVKKYEYLSKIIIIGPAPENKENGDAKKAAEETFEFLFQLVKSGIAPNPHRGDFTDDAYLARKWSGDIAPRPKLPKSEGIIAALDLNTPSDAYEYMDNEKTLYKIAPLPFYEREKLNNKTPGEKWSYAVMGLWSLGITQPALSPEIGWIFIDALTEDKFVEMRAKKGLGLPAKVSAYERESIRKAQPDIYGAPDAKGKIKGIVDYYELASQDKARKEAQEDNQKDIIRRRTRERASIPYYYQIEEFLIKELSRFFEPSFFDTLAEKEKDKRGVIINDVLKRIHNRIKNFLIKEFELDERKNS
ncbi:MAG TPA: hypothetical protein VK469_11245, partial [Candidatus Kapabacteria bacterium]|nr:hypothetical protein [Candidatus Kapabacteria bacterium]